MIDIRDKSSQDESGADRRTVYLINKLTKINTISDRITVEHAQIIAAHEIAARASRSQARDFAPVRLHGEDAVTWKFVSVSEQLIKEGYVPGAIIIRVDKQDGHVWTDEETERCLGEQQVEVA